MNNRPPDFWELHWYEQILSVLLLIVAFIGIAGAMGGVCGIIVGTFVRGYRLVAG